jgi:hypothetical protein
LTNSIWYTSPLPKEYQCIEIQGGTKNDPPFLLTIKWQVCYRHSLNCTGELNALLCGDSQRDMWILYCYKNDVQCQLSRWLTKRDWLSSKEWKLFCFFAKTKSTVTTKRSFCPHFGTRQTPSQKTIHRLTQQNSLSLSKNVLMLQVFTAQNIYAVRVALQWNLIKSTRKAMAWLLWLDFHMSLPHKFTVCDQQQSGVCCLSGMWRGNTAQHVVFRWGTLIPRHSNEQTKYALQSYRTEMSNISIIAI